MNFPRARVALYRRDKGFDLRVYLQQNPPLVPILAIASFKTRANVLFEESAKIES